MEKEGTEKVRIKVFMLFKELLNLAKRL
jgi:hypothetical protein